MKKARFLFFVGIVFLFAFATQAQATLVNSWYYKISSVFTSATGGSINNADHTILSWGSGGSSRLYVTNTPVKDWADTYVIGSGDNVADYWAASVTLNHENNPIYAPFLTAATLTTTVSLYLTEGDEPTDDFVKKFVYDFNIKFAETSNVGGWQEYDVFALTSGLPNLSFDYDSNDYYVNLFPTNAGSFSTFASMNTSPQNRGTFYAAQAGVPLDTLGFVTAEGVTTTVPFSFVISSTPLSLATPEPSTLLLLGFGMVGLAGIARRKLSK